MVKVSVEQQRRQGGTKNTGKRASTRDASRDARFFSSYYMHTKMGKIYVPNDHKIYQMITKYTK
jgi:hypothetical protein